MPSNQVMVSVKEIHYHHIHLCFAWNGWRNGLRRKRRSRPGDQFKHLEEDLAFHICCSQMTSCSLQRQQWIRSQELDEFGKASRQKVGFNKSQVYFSLNIFEKVVAFLSSRLGIPRTDELDKYLGFQLLHSGRNIRTQKELVLKARNKMAIWKLKCLSKVGRITMAASVLNSIPVFYMHIMQMPAKTHKALDKSCR